jgi:hypothetical protein
MVDSVNTKLKILIATPLVIIGLLVLVVVGYVAYGIAFRTHQDPIFNIGNDFGQPVTVYFEGQKVGRINSGESRIFYPNEALTKTNRDLLVELKSNSGEMLYSRLYTWDELDAVLASVRGRPYWIGYAK